MDPLMRKLREMGARVIAISPDELHCVSWIPEENREPTQVNVVIIGKSTNQSINAVIIPFSNPQIVAELIDSLIDHKREVWPEN